MAIVSGGGILSGEASKPVLARRTDVELSFDGFDMTDIMAQYFTSFTYTDSEEDESDDIEITLQDRDMIWLRDWLPELIDKAAAEMLTVSATIVQKYQDGTDMEARLPCGTFELDSVECSGPPNTVTLKGTALPYSSQIRQRTKSKTWENYKLSGIAGEIASKAGFTLYFESEFDPLFESKEQRTQTDIAFLSRLCSDAGLILKVSDKQLIIFDSSIYESKEPVADLYYGVNVQTTAYGVGPGGLKAGQSFYKKYKLSSKSAGVQYDSCRVSYVVPTTGKLIEGIAYTDDYQKELDSVAERNAEKDSGDELDKADEPRQLEVTMKVSSAGEAEWYAAKQLRLRNKYSRAATITMPGNTALVAGVTVNLHWFGGFEGKYYVQKAKHTVKPSTGYQTQVDLIYI